MIGIDREFLVHHSSFTADGVAERAFHIDIDGTRCFAVLDEPARSSDLGFLLCHSYGLEFLTLRRAERAMARGLARLGYPVLAFHQPGYGDSEGTLGSGTLDSHLRAVEEASRALAERASVRRIGLIGCRFGGLIAAAHATRGGVDRMVLVNPILRGRSFAREMIRDMHVVQLTPDQGGDHGSVSDSLVALQSHGIVDVLGYPIYRALADSLAPIDLSTDLGLFDGDVLLVQVSKGTRVPSSMQSFRSRVEANGGRCRVVAVREPPGTRFGGPPYTSAPGDWTVKVDAQVPIVDGLEEAILTWMR
jgi:pimeloyl-ACP methyl ester carboxylesterase